MNFVNQISVTIVILCLLMPSISAEDSLWQSRDVRLTAEEDVEIKKYGAPISTKYYQPLGEITEDPGAIEYEAIPVSDTF